MKKLLVIPIMGAYYLLMVVMIPIQLLLIIVSKTAEWVEDFTNQVSIYYEDYLMNPSYRSKGGSIDAPSFTIVARMDKTPPYLITTKQGETAIVIYKSDSPAMQRIKEFMAIYGIVDIKMRMLNVGELKRIMGFGSDYTLIGTQTEQKKYIGNAVEVNMSRVLCEALAAKLNEI